jgi:hypothetical protein
VAELVDVAARAVAEAALRLTDQQGHEAKRRGRQDYLTNARRST